MTRQAEHETTARADRVRGTSEGASFRVGSGGGPSVELGPSTPGRLLVGKSSSCALVVPDPRVSRRHLALEVAGDLLHVVDLGSTNGTRVNGLLITDAFLRGGEVLQIGDTPLSVEFVSGRTAVPLWPVDTFGRVRGVSAAMRRLYPVFQKLAASALPLLVEGESGTGKELLAESLHEMGPRKNAPFVVFDGTTHPTSELESILFGERESKGTHAREGLFQQANGGTLLVDRVDELPLVLQAKLLRAIERGEICRVRDDRWVRVDVRIIATTRKNLDREVELGRFREDLFYRLAARVELPPLRAREGDVPLLAEHFWQQLGGRERGVPGDLLDGHAAYAWPGNVRELRHVVARKLALGEHQGLGTATPALPVVPFGAEGDAVFARLYALKLPFSEARARVIGEFERFWVERVLAEHGGNVSRAAAASGLARRYFQILRTRHDAGGSR